MIVPLRMGPPSSNTVPLHCVLNDTAVSVQIVTVTESHRHAIQQAREILHNKVRLEEGLDRRTVEAFLTHHIDRVEEGRELIADFIWQVETWPLGLAFAPSSSTATTLRHCAQESILHSKATRHASSSTAAPAMEGLLYRSPN